MSEGAKLAGSSALATPKRRDPNAYTSDKELQKIVIGSSLVKITAQVSAEIFFREKLLSVWMLSEDNKKIRSKSLLSIVMDKSSTEKKSIQLDKLHEQCVYGNILRLEKLKAVAVHNPKYHDSPYSYELLFNENSTVRKIGSIFKTQSNISAPSPLADVYKSFKYFANCSPKDKNWDQMRNGWRIRKNYLQTFFILAILAKDESAELILKKDTAANVKEFGSDHLIKNLFIWRGSKTGSCFNSTSTH